MLLPALSPAPGLPVPRARLLGAGREHGQGIPRPPHGVLGQHHGPEGGQSQPYCILSFFLNTASVLTSFRYRKDLFSFSFRVEN